MNSSPDLDPDNAALAAMVTALERCESAISGLQAMKAVVMAHAFELAEHRASTQSARVKATEMELRNISMEIGAALHISDRAIQAQLFDAWSMIARFPAAHAALAAGEISLAHVRVMTDVGAGIHDDDARAKFTERATEIARSESPRRLRGMIAPLAEIALPQSITERHVVAREGRRVELRELPDGMCELWALLPTVLGHGIHERLTRMGVEVKRLRRAESGSGTGATRAGSVGTSSAVVGSGSAGVVDPSRPNSSDGAIDPPELGSNDHGSDQHGTDERGIDQLRADFLCELLLSGSPDAAGEGLGSINGHVEVTVPAFTLAGLSDAGASLAGGIPIDADTARALAGAASGWDRVLTHPVTGAVLAIDRYRPSKQIRRALAARDGRCRQKTCTQPVLRVDADHLVDAALGGETSLENLCLQCRRHHSLKHATPWQVKHLGDGLIEWTSPLGRTYRDQPQRMVSFTPVTLDDVFAQVGTTLSDHQSTTGYQSTTDRQSTTDCQSKSDRQSKSNRQGTTDSHSRTNRTEGQSRTVRLLESWTRLAQPDGDPAPF